MTLDIKRLSLEAEKLHRERSLRPKRGTYVAIQKALPDILLLREKGVRWADIAAALAAQGVTQGSGDKIEPISTSRLTALVSDIQKRDAKKRERRINRTGRPDIAMPLEQNVGQYQKSGLAPELTLKRADDSTASATVVDDEDAIRRKRYADVQIYLK